MNCPRCGAVNPNDSRFCGHCGAPLQPSAVPPSLSGPGTGVPAAPPTASTAGGLVGLLAAVLGAVGLGVVADYLVRRVSARLTSCACGCLFVIGFLLCVLIAGLAQNGLGR